MWTAAAAATTVSFPSFHFRRNSLTNRTEVKCLTLKLKATNSFFDYPLASRVIVSNRFFTCLEFWMSLFVVLSDLPYSTSEKRLLENFSDFGNIAEVKLVKDNQTKRSKGFAFIQFTSQDDAMYAIETMDNQKLDGRVISVEIAKPGRAAFRGSPRSSGPPIKQLSVHQSEDVDCWY